MTALGRIRSVYGDAFVAYVLAVTVEELDAIPPTPERTSAVDLLAAMASPPLVVDEKLDWDHVYRLVGPGGAMALHLSCGGSIPPTFTADDSTVVALRRCVLEAFSLLLLPPPENPVHSILFAGISAAAMDVQSHPILVRQILEDEALRELFLAPDDINVWRTLPEDHLRRISADHFWATGEGGTAFVGLIAANLICHALIMTAVTGDDVTSEAALHHAGQGLTTARALARGQKTKVPFIVTLSDISFENEAGPADTSYGPLRKVCPLAAGILHTPGVFTDHRFRQPTLALITEVTDCSVHSERRWPTDQSSDGSWFDKTASARNAVRREVSASVAKLRYAMLLASSDIEYLVPSPIGYFSVNPLGGCNAAPPLEPTGSAINRQSGVIGQVTSHDIAIWSRRVDTEHPNSLDFGMRRLLSAITRPNPIDGFVDAVLCWENLFGGAAETTLKVTGSLTVLLEPDNGKRQALFRELKKLYTTRSDIVHGNKEPDRSAAIAFRKRATEIARQAMKAAYDVPGLLDLPTSADRNVRMLVGFPLPTATEPG